MSYRTGSKGLGVLAAALVFGAPLTASAHAYIVDPPARDITNPDKDARAHKDPNGPCGKIARVGAPKKYAPGATVTVKFEETIGHRGCYQIRFSAANDMPAVLKDWQLLLQIDDPTGTTAGIQSATVTLPTTPCPACTLAVWQLMQGTACPANADPALAIQNTYYSCADICIGNAGDPCTTAPSPDAGAGDAGSDGGSSSSSGTSGTSGATTSSSGGGDDDDTTSSSSGTAGPSGRRPTTSNDGGCALTNNSTPELSLAAILGFVGLAIVRRRRNR